MIKPNLNLNPGDVIVVPKSNLQFINPHDLHLGLDREGTEWIIENNSASGVRLIRAQ